MKPLYILMGIIFSVIIIMALTGCTPSGSQTDPLPVGVKDSPYTLDYVELPDGRTVTCLWYYKGSSGGAMSCDWENTN